MKKTTHLLNVDFIGDQNAPITNEELKLIDDFFQKKKIAKKSLKSKKMAIATN
jgi:hypothetical protein